MAPRMKLAVLASVGAVAVIWLRLTPLEPQRFPPSPDAQEARLVADLDRALELDAVLRRIRWEDSIRGVLAQAGPAEEIVDGHPPETPASTRRRAAEAVERWAPEDASGPRVVAGFFTVPIRQGGHAAIDGLPRPPARSGVEWYAGTLADGTPYCVQLAPATRDDRGLPRIRTPRLDEEALGPCRFWYRYGPPGPAIEEWIAAGAYGFTVLDTLPALGPRSAERLLRLLRDAIGPIGLTTDAFRCVSGDTSTCAAMVFDPETLSRSFREQRRQTPRAAAGVTGFAGSLEDAYALGVSLPRGGVERVLMATLERELGRERFARFWRSDLAPAAALERALGVEAGVWVRDFYGTHYGTRTRGPFPLPDGGVPAGLLVLSCVAVAAVSAGRRRAG